MTFKLRCSLVIVAALLTLVIAFCAWMSLAQAPTATFAQPGWGSGATLQLRADGAGGLLFAPGIRYIDPPAGVLRHDAYRYEPGKRALMPVTTETWSAATGEVVDCDRAGLELASGVSADGEEFLIKGRAVPIAGRVRQARGSPDGRLVAVVSASAISLPSTSVIPTIGGPRIVGWRYHRLISVASGRPIGDPVGLGFGSSDPTPCWSPDGRLVLYADAAFATLAVVRVIE